MTHRRILRISFDIFFWTYLLFITGISLLWIIPSGGVRDFGSFVASGRLAVKGGNPYTDDDPLIFLVKVDELNLYVQSPNLNPPITVLVFEILNINNAQLGYRIWQILSLVMYIVCIYILALTYPDSKIKYKVIWALCLTGFWHIIELGQIYVFLLLALTLSQVMFHRKNPKLAGIFIGILIAIKPNFVIWLIFLFLGKKYKSLIAALITAFVLTVIPILHYGPEIYFDWREAVMSYQGYIMPNNHSVNGILSSLGYSHLSVFINLLIFGISLWIAYRAPIETDDLNALAVITALLISPITWTGYSILLLPYFFSRPWSRTMLFAAIIFAVPLPFYISYVFSRFSFVDFVVVGRIFGWAMLALWIEEIIRLMLYERRIVVANV